MRLSLGDLLAQEALGLTSVADVGDPGAVPILGAHAIEIDDPTRWLPPGWLMLTTGLRLRGRADKQRRLVAELHDHGQAGLAWGIGLVVQQVPRAIVEEAERRGLPVVAVPSHVPFREVIAYVNGSLVSDELYVLRRVASMQDYLMDALAAADPAAAILERVAGMLGAEVVLLGADGRRLAGGGRGDDAALADVLAAVRSAASGAPAEAVVTHGHALAAVVSRGDRRLGWLGVVPPDRPFADQLARPLLRSAARLLGLLELLDHQDADRVRARRAEVLVAILRTPAAADALTLAHEARAIGLDPGAPACGVAWGLEGRPAEPAVALVEGLLERAGAPFLLASRVPGPVAVVQGDAASVAAIIADGELPAGVGRPFTGLAGAAGSVADAEVVLRHAAASGSRVLAFDALDPASWLLARCEVDGGAETVTELLAPLAAHPRLLETLRCYFEVDLDVGRAAAGLDLHRNTLRYRLARIEALLGLRLAGPGAIAGVHMALLAERVRPG